eukprot:m.58695 g.58695  ORF g.58695 m.58695 type:complete len:393 (-) comp13783_c0_seq1:121-1299(-)
MTLRNKAEPPSVSAPWQAHWSNSKQRWYFYNDETDSNHWVLPEDAHEEDDSHGAEELPTFDNLASNPHLKQVVANTFADYHSLTDLVHTRNLNVDSPRAAYRRRREEVKSVLNWGPRETIVAGIEFLTEYADDGNLVVYQGTATTSPLTYLAECFPKLKFHIFDPDGQITIVRDHVQVRRTALTEANAEVYATQGVLFISEIKTLKLDIMTEKEQDQSLLNDMDLQMKLHLKLKPKKALLTFRLPWQKGSSPYLKGQLILPIWGAVTTTECRLIPDEGYTHYDHAIHEEHMFYFNTVQRVARYKHDVQGEGLDHCYDCFSEICVLSAYLRKHHGITDPKELSLRVAELAGDISRALGERTLKDPNPSMDDIRQRKGKRQARQSEDQSKRTPA